MMQHRQSVLVSGASFAGLATAYWMNRLGYAVTVVEVGKGMKMGGTPVDIREGTVDIVRRMGLLGQIRAKSLKPKTMEFLEADGTRVGTMMGRGEAEPAEEYEIERDDLLRIMFGAVQEDVEFRFADSIASMEERAAEVAVTFKSGDQRDYALVFGCDGTHSAVRRICFGDEALYSKFMQCYFSITIVDKLLLADDSSQMYNVPGKAIMLHSYHGKSDIAFCFFAEAELPYDRRDAEQQKRMIVEAFEHVGWRTPELLAEIGDCRDFYFDKLCQIRMDAWSKGRVALVGDAGYCASPAAGMGGSLAIVGATALADAFGKHPDDYTLAFAEYDRSLRPFVDEVQANAIAFGVEMLVPRTEEAIRARNAQLSGG